MFSDPLFTIDYKLFTGRSPLRIALHTDTLGFAADIADVLRIFWGEVQVVPLGVGADATLIHHHGREGDEWVDTCSWEMTGETGTKRISHTDRRPVVSGPLVGKRMQKRAVKTCCYALIKQTVRFQPPWGSLTGIRPTRLYYEQLAGGATPKQAEAALVSLFDLAPSKAALLGETLAKGLRDRSIIGGWLSEPSVGGKSEVGIDHAC